MSPLRSFILVTSVLASSVLVPSEVRAQLVGAPTIAFQRSDECGRSRLLLVQADFGQGVAHASVRAQFIVTVSVVLFQGGIQIGSIQQDVAPTIPFNLQLEVPFEIVGRVNVTATVALRSYVGRRGGPVLQKASTTLADVPMGEDPMHAIYGALRIESLRMDQPSYSPGQLPGATYSLANRSEMTLCVPSNRFFPQLHTVGTINTWIERLGDDNTIPGIPPFIARDAAGRYAAGGSIIADFPFPDNQWPPNAAFERRWDVIYDTSQFPVGGYRLSVEYQRGFTEGHGEQVIQVASIDFEIN